MAAGAARRRRRGALILGCALLAAATFGAGCGDGSEGPSFRATLPSGTATPRPVPTSTPLPPPSAANPFKGSAQVDDATGDVDGQGDIPPGIDLRAVRIMPSESQLVFTWYPTETAQTSVGAGNTAGWTVELANGDQPVYDVTVRVVDKEWDILIVDRATGEETKHRIASIYRDRIEVPYPASQLRKLDPAFSWTARAEWTDGAGNVWVDRVPDGEARATFP
jgi:hypothetical protein